MNIEDMKKVWDSESNSNLYVIDQRTVDKMVRSKANSSNRNATLTENMIIAINIIVPIVLFGIAIANNNIGLWEYLMAIFAVLTILFVLHYRQKRIKNDDQWGDSVSDELDRSIHYANIKVKMIRIFTNWYISGIALLTLTNMYMQNINPWLILMIALIMLVGYVVSLWELKNLHQESRDHLVSIREKLNS